MHVLTSTAALASRGAKAAASDHWLRPLLARLLPGYPLADAEAPDGLWARVVRAGAIDDGRLLDAAAEFLALPRADLERATPQAVELVGERWVRRFHVLPLTATERELWVATANPFDLDCERTLAFASGRIVRFALTSPIGLAERIDAACRGELARAGPFAAAEVQHLGRESETVAQVAPAHERETVVRLVDQLLAEAVTLRASDLHLETEERGIAVRHRVDGVLRLARVLPRGLAPALVSRIKILSGLDIADRLRPQDGRARVAVNGQAVDLRVSTLPASHGEKVVVRILDGQAVALSLDAMGFLPEEHERIQRLLQAREGLLLVTGPTGSGKTTTLYAALRQVQERAVNIVTVEDPIEYRLPGIVQVQVHERAGLSFGTALRSIMRQDPDVILIGEIRDRETAEIAIQASLTGHLVFSTLHTNDAPSAVTRLLDIGVAPHKIAAALQGVLAQRLVRRLCPACRAPSASTARERERVGADVAALMRAGGCDACGGSGYRGRLAIAEVLVVTPEVERRIGDGASVERIAAAARAEGLGSLWHSGLAHVRAGDTTLEELERVAEPVPAPALAAPRERRHDGVHDRPGAGYIAGVAAPRGAAPARGDGRVAELLVGTVDAYVVRPLPGGWKVLVLQRALDTRCPTAWETVHGRLEAGEEPEEGALREVREETGLEATRLYSVTVQPYYLQKMRAVQLAVVFCAFVDEPAEVVLGPEHQAHEWLSVDEALRRYQWPRERQALQEIVELLGTGDAGPVEDVLRVM